MNIMMIAVIQKNKQNIGFRLFDTDDKAKKYMDVPVDSVKQVLSAGKAEIVNLGLQNGEIVGLNGVLDRYPKINTEGILLNKVSPLVIISQIGDLGYTVVDYQGRIKKARTSDVVEYAKKYGIANGKVVMKDNIEFISSIVGTYKTEVIAKSKVNNEDDSVKIHIKMNNNVDNSNRVVKNTEVEVDVEIEDHDVFSVMTESQKEVLKDYYVWYTVDKYLSLAHNIRLDIALEKAEVLSELRGNTEWEFGGVWDSGCYGLAKCQLGHSLRYEYYAVPADDRDNPDSRIIFGETCASDFFSIKPKDMRNLVKTRTIMSDEIKLMSDIITNGLEKLYMSKAKLLYSMLRKLSTRENIVGLFGEKVGDTLISFIMVKLPFPMSLVLEASKSIVNKVGKLYTEIFPEYKNEILEILCSNSRASILQGGKLYLNFMATNKIEGDYAYNPLDETIKRREIGGYNKQTRYERKSLLRNIRDLALCKEFTLEETECLLYSFKKLNEFRGKVIDKLKDTEYTTTKKNELLDLVKEFVIEVDDPKIITERTAIYNCLVSDDNYIMNDRRLVQFLESQRGLRYRHIGELKADLVTAEKDFDNTLELFYNKCKDIDKEREEALREMEEQDRLYKELEAKMEKEREEAEKIEREKREKEEAELLKNDKTEILKRLIENNPDIPVDKGIEVAKAILEYGKPFDSLTAKQQWRINKTIKIYEEGIKKDKEEYNSSNDTKVSEVNISYDEVGNPEVYNKVQRILKLAEDNDDSIVKVLKEYPLVVKIAQTIDKYKKVSEKQLKHINKAIDMLDQA